jgi:uncharacterized protein involved in exopolysaccharide biosynthesis
MQSSMLAQQNASARVVRTVAARPSDLEKQIADLRAQLATLETRYTPEHPEVVKTKGQIGALERQLELARAVPVETDASANVVVPENPESAQLRASVEALDQRIKSKRVEQAQLEQQINAFQARIQLSPVVEEQFKGLTRDYESALQFYNELLTKKTQSEMVRDLEIRREGEQFRVMDAPGLPSKPSSPDRQKFALAGLASGFALGALLSAILETKERFIRTEKDVETHIGVPVLAVIPKCEPS